MSTPHSHLYTYHHFRPLWPPKAPPPHPDRPPPPPPPPPPAPPPPPPVCARRRFHSFDSSSPFLFLPALVFSLSPLSRSFPPRRFKIPSPLHLPSLLSQLATRFRPSCLPPVFFIPFLYPSIIDPFLLYFRKLLSNPLCFQSLLATRSLSASYFGFLGSLGQPPIYKFLLTSFFFGNFTSTFLPLSEFFPLPPYGVKPSFLLLHFRPSIQIPPIVFIPYFLVSRASYQRLLRENLHFPTCSSVRSRRPLSCPSLPPPFFLFLPFFFPPLFSCCLLSL